jgi:hypothetical protein
MATPGQAAEGLGSRPREHIFIAGTGRAGTSFLVRYLAELGLDTHLARHPAKAGWDEAANAGLEDLAPVEPVEELPYVVKSPWLYEFIDEIVERNAIRIEVVIVPVRDLAEAAMSRSLVELRALHQAAPWMAMLHKTWESWGYTPGGSVFSLNPLDQARLLAVGFHVLIEKLVKAEIPILLLEFPRLAQDGAYLFDKLRPWLPADITADQALGAHCRIADAAKIRVGREVQAERDWFGPSPGQASPVVEYQDHDRLDHVAIRRELIRLQDALVKSEAKLSAMRACWSWKATRPLRGITIAVRRIVHSARPTADGPGRLAPQPEPVRARATPARSAAAIVDDESRRQDGFLPVPPHRPVF